MFFLIFCAAKTLQVNIREAIIKRKLIRGEYWISFDRCHETARSYLIYRRLFFVCVGFMCMNMMFVMLLWVYIHTGQAEKFSAWPRWESNPRLVS
jgi:hypothetical protein